jgi:hypothetical protein
VFPAFGLMNRNTWIWTAEIVLVLPATMYLAPMAASSALGMMFAIVQDLRLGWDAQFMLIGMMVWFLAAVVGIISLWMAMTVPAESLARCSTLRVGLVIGIGAGIAAALYWLWNIGHERGMSLSIWLLMLAGPIIVGIRHAFRLTRLAAHVHPPITNARR